MPPRRRNSMAYNPITKRFIEIDPPEKPPRVELTEEEKKKVIESFKEIIKREPTPDEVEELLSEELKIKQGSTLI